MILPDHYDYDSVVAKIAAIGKVTGKIAEADAMIAQRPRTTMKALADKLATANSHAARAVPAVDERWRAAGRRTRYGRRRHHPLAGGVNAVDGYSGYRPLTPESVIASNADFVLVTRQTVQAMGGIEAILDQPSLSRTPAGKAGKIIQFDTLLLLGFGPRTPEAATELAAGAASRAGARNKTERFYNRNPRSGVLGSRGRGNAHDTSDVDGLPALRAERACFALSAPAVRARRSPASSACASAPFPSASRAAVGRRPVGPAARRHDGGRPLRHPRAARVRGLRRRRGAGRRRRGDAEPVPQSPGRSRPARRVERRGARGRVGDRAGREGDAHRAAGLQALAACRSPPSSAASRRRSSSIASPRAMAITLVGTLLLAGIAINALASAGIGLLVFVADEQQLRTLIFWTMGGFGAVTWVAILPALLVLLDQRADLAAGRASARRAGARRTRGGPCRRRCRAAEAPPGGAGGAGGRRRRGDLRHRGLRRPDRAAHRAPAAGARAPHACCRPPPCSAAPSWCWPMRSPAPWSRRPSCRSAC